MGGPCYFFHLSYLILLTSKLHATSLTQKNNPCTKFSLLTYTPERSSSQVGKIPRKVFYEKEFFFKKSNFQK
jgi:hypothetical protein